MDFRFINPEYLDSVSGGDAGIINDLVTLFRNQATEIVDSMFSALETKDYLQLSLLAHKIKSSVAIMGMDDLASMLKTLELKARESADPDSYRGYIERLKNDTTSALIELDNLILIRSGKKL